MDFNKCNIKAINDFSKESDKWNKDKKQAQKKAARKGNPNQPSKRKKRAKR